MGSNNSVPVNSNNSHASQNHWQEFQFRQQQQLQQQMQQWNQIAQMSMQMNSNNQGGGYSQQNPIHFNLDNSVTLTRSGGDDLSSYELTPSEPSSGSGPLAAVDMPDSAAQHSGAWRAKVDLSTVVTPPPPVEFKTLSTFDLKAVGWTVGMPTEDQTWKIAGFLFGLLGGLVFICLGLVVLWKCGGGRRPKRRTSQ
ncbi:unnamed protein product [Oikopleura dioica]|uniref:Uncharacterized protein n=1 Tax=Oikopleura dioica TaxID=34765 RepID=E4YUR4_OIKDI|nr:unnamed protein product [Oikopleura dioica]